MGQHKDTDYSSSLLSLLNSNKFRPSQSRCLCFSASGASRWCQLAAWCKNSSFKSLLPISTEIKHRIKKAWSHLVVTVQCSPIIYLSPPALSYPTLSVWEVKSRRAASHLISFFLITHLSKLPFLLLLLLFFVRIALVTESKHRQLLSLWCQHLR